MTVSPLTIGIERLPAVMPRDVVRVEDGGKPSAALLQWEQAQRDFYAKNVVDLQTKVTTVSSQTDQNTASIVEERTARTSADEAEATARLTLTARVGTAEAAIVNEQTVRANADSAEATARVALEARVGAAEASVTTEQTARSNADGALAQQISSVNASLGAAFASGQIYFAAMATPAGATAAYGIFLSAGNTFTGLQMIAKSDGTSAIVLNANQLAFNDSGTNTNVFSYVDGVFTFNVPVRIRNQDLALNAATNGGGSTSAVNLRPAAETTLTVREGSRVIVTGVYIPSVTAAQAPNTTVDGSLSFTCNNGNIGSVGLAYRAVDGSVTGGTVVQFRFRPDLTVNQVTLTLGAGTYTFAAQTGGSSANVHGTAVITVIELSR